MIKFAAGCLVGWFVTREEPIIKIVAFKIVEVLDDFVVKAKSISNSKSKG